MEPVLCLSLSIVAWFAAVVGSGDDLPKAETLLDQFEAKGNDVAARRAMKSLVMKGSVSVPGMPSNGTIEEVYLDADQVRYTTTFPVMGSQTQGRAQNRCWTTDPGFGVAVKEGDEQGCAPRMFAIGRRAEWRSLYQRAETMGRAPVNGRPHYEIKMIPKSGKPDRWFLDCDSLLLSCVDLALPDPAGGDEIPCRFAYSEWKPVAGILFPHVKKQLVAGMEIVFTFDTIMPNAPVSAEAVAPPKEVIDAIKDPKKRTPTPTQPGECQVDTVKAQPAATVRMTVKVSEISKSLAIMLPEVGAYLSQTGTMPVGPPFSRYHKIDGDTIDLEAGIAVKTPIKGGGRVQASELPAGKVAITWHVGPYDRLSQTHELLRKWIAAQSLEASGGFWEVYWTDPGLEPDANKWKTQIVWPLK